MATLYRVCRDVFSMKPPLSLSQFLSKSFPEKKLNMAADIVRAVGDLQRDLQRNKSAHSLRRKITSPPGSLSRDNSTKSSNPMLLPPFVFRKTDCHDNSNVSLQQVQNLLIYCSVVLTICNGSSRRPDSYSHCL